jgi:UrcA family protein
MKREIIMFKISSAATALALATLPMLAIAGGAQAAPVSVQVGDLDINTAPGAEAFAQRVNVAAHEFCRYATRAQSGLRNLGDNQNCKRAVREEMAEKAAARNDAMLAKAKSSTLASR